MTAQASELEAAVIDPVQASVIGETFSYGVAQGMAQETVFAIARVADKWLLFRPGKAEFSLAYGPDAGMLKIWGFSSSDALAEWLG